MALKGALGEEGAALFADWSAQAVKDEPATTAKAWASFKPDRIGAGSIYHLAMERGLAARAGHVSRWQSACGRCSSSGGPSRAARCARCGDVRAARTAPPFTLTIPDGLVGDLARYMIDTARRPQPLLAVGASLCALGALMGRRYRTESNLRSNLYIVGIADSGSGKNHAREIVNEVFFEAGPRAPSGWQQDRLRRGAADRAPPPARDPVPDRRVRHVPLGGGRPEAQPAPHHRDPRQHDRALHRRGGIFLGAEYANRDGTNERRDIVQPCLCVYGTTTPLHFWGALQGANVMDGSLARFLILL